MMRRRRMRMRRRGNDFLSSPLSASRKHPLAW
jgi:hypothetical protein